MTVGFRCGRTGRTSSPAMFDAITAHPEVDPGQVALVGRSFGGLIAPGGAPGRAPARRDDRRPRPVRPGGGPSAGWAVDANR